MSLPVFFLIKVRTGETRKTERGGRKKRAQQAGGGCTRGRAEVNSLEQDACIKVAEGRMEVHREDQEHSCPIPSSLSHCHMTISTWSVALFRLLQKGSQAFQPQAEALAMLSHPHRLPSGLKTLALPPLLLVEVGWPRGLQHT